MGYENVQRLFEVQVDGTEVQVVWKGREDSDPAERVFLQLDTELALEWVDSPQAERVWLLCTNYGDLLAEHLASYLADLFE